MQSKGSSCVYGIEVFFSRKSFIIFRSSSKTFWLWLTSFFDYPLGSGYALFVDVTHGGNLYKSRVKGYLEHSGPTATNSHKSHADFGERVVVSGEVITSRQCRGKSGFSDKVSSTDGFRCYWIHKVTSA